MTKKTKPKKTDLLTKEIENKINDLIIPIKELLYRISFVKMNNPKLYGSTFSGEAKEVTNITYNYIIKIYMNKHIETER